MIKVKDVLSLRHCLGSKDDMQLGLFYFGSIWRINHVACLGNKGFYEHEIEKWKSICLVKKHFLLKKKNSFVYIMLIKKSILTSEHKR